MRHVGTLAAPEGFSALVTVRIGPDGPVAVWSTPEGRDALESHRSVPGGGSFPRTRADATPVALAAYPDGTTPTGVVRTSISVTFPLVQPLPDGAYLLVGSRCEWRPDGPEKNAVIVGADGEVVRRGTLGDGIQDVQTDRDGGIWVSYFDEGVFGNFGWGAPGPPPLGSAGLVLWSGELTKEWEFTDGGSTLISDCYALNVSDDGVLACSYTDFPLIRIRDDVVSVAPTDGIVGPAGILADGDTIAVIDAHARTRRILIGQFGSTFRPTSRARLRIPRAPDPARTRLTCRGASAHYFVDADWYRADLDHAAAPDA